MRVDWTDLALDRADEIAQHIAEDDREAAVRWMVGLFDAADRLSDFPESGRMVPELGQREVRELVWCVQGLLSGGRRGQGAERAAREPAHQG